MRAQGEGEYSLRDVPKATRGIFGAGSQQRVVDGRKRRLKHA